MASARKEAVEILRSTGATVLALALLLDNTPDAFATEEEWDTLLRQVKRAAGQVAVFGKVLLRAHEREEKG